MKVFVALLALIAVSSALPHNEWLAFKARHGKSYANELEENFRMKVFLKNKDRIEEHNARFEQGLVSYTVKMNRFGDMLPEEFAMKMNGFNATKQAMRVGGNVFVPTNKAVPKSVDWRTKGAVTPVKDQGQCGSCWAFSTTGSLEGQNFLKNGKLVSLSEQNLVDCSGSYGNMGCSGGLMDSAFNYIKDNKGIDTESSYPYEASDDSCRFTKSNVGATDKGAIDIPAGDENALKEAVATVGPISVAIDASNWSFQMYSGGVYNERSCSSSQLDHGVLAVGYGTDENGVDYWLVKNSWASVWGEQGYIKMSRNKNNQCGIASMASYPSV